MKRTHSIQILTMESKKAQAIEEFETKEKKKHEIFMENIRQKSRALKRELEQKISEIENSEREQLAREEERFLKIKKRFEAKLQPIKEALAQLEKDMDYFSIKNNIESTDVFGWMNQRLLDKAKFKKLKMMKLAAIHSIVGPAEYNSSRRRKNPLNVQIRIVCFNPLFKEMCKKRELFNWDEILKIEKVESVSQGQEWLQKHFEKATADFIKFHDEVVAKMESLDLNPAQEFDFRMASMNNAGQRIIRKTKSTLVVEIDEQYPYKTLIELNHVGMLTFNLSVTKPSGQYQKNDNKNVSNEKIALDLLRYYHPLGLNESQVKIQIVKPSSETVKRKLVS
jgi:hypothetical protein